MIEWIECCSFDDLPRFKKMFKKLEKEGKINAHHLRKLKATIPDLEKQVKKLRRDEEQFTKQYGGNTLSLEVLQRQIVARQRARQVDPFAYLGKKYGGEEHQYEIGSDNDNQGNATLQFFKIWTNVLVLLWCILKNDYFYLFIK